MDNAVHQNSSDRIIRNILRNRSAYYDEDQTTESKDITSTMSYDGSSEQQTSSDPPAILTSTILYAVDSLADLPTTEYSSNDLPVEPFTTQPDFSFPSSTSGVPTNNAPYSYGQSGVNIEHIFFTTLKPPFNMEPLPVWYSPSAAAWSAFRPSHPEYSGDSNVFLPILTQQ